MKKYKNLIIILLVIALLIGADAIIMKKVISDKLAEEKSTEAISETTAEKTSETYTEDDEDEDGNDSEDRNDDYYFDMDIEKFMEEYCADKNPEIEKYAQGRVCDMIINKDGTGIAVCDADGGMSKVMVKLLKTTDGGKTWKIIQKVYSYGAGSLAYFDGAIIHFKYSNVAYDSEVNILDGDGNLKETLNLTQIFGMSRKDNEFSFNVIAEIIEAKEHSVIVGWKPVDSSSSESSDKSEDSYDSYVYVGEFDSEFNEIEQLHKDKAALDEIKVENVIPE